MLLLTIASWKKYENVQQNFIREYHKTKVDISMFTSHLINTNPIDISKDKSYSKQSSQSRVVTVNVKNLSRLHIKKYLTNNAKSKAENIL